jgi:hypothetical protein
MNMMELPAQEEVELQASKASEKVDAYHYQLSIGRAYAGVNQTRLDYHTSTVTLVKGYARVT